MSCQLFPLTQVFNQKNALNILKPDIFYSSLCLCQGRLKLTVLSEDRLQMKWKEADGPVQGYKVRVRPISGERSPAVKKVLWQQS